MFEKVKRIFKRNKTEEVQKVPKEWIKNKPNVSKNQKSGLVTIKFQKGRKLRMPGLRIGKRLLAVFLLGFNFFVAQAALTSAPASQAFSILFYANCFIALDYLWKTRKKRVEWGK